ncbi:ABC-type amino acid transporter, membrane-spanning permease [Streptococcus pneumoniae]|nr:ABC-type amino acid transporter, membrane-spanning permease [Streptococcus pneumoniae]
MESILEVLTPDNLVFIFKGFGLTLYISLIAIILSTIIGTVLAVMRNGKNPILRIISSIYIEFVRNVPNLLWIFTIFLVFKMKSTPAGITAFTLFTSAALAEIIRGGHKASPQPKSSTTSFSHKPSEKCYQPSFLSLLL